VAGWIDLRGYASLRRSGVVFAVFGLHDVSGPIEKIAVLPPAPDDCVMIREDDQVVLNSPGARSSRGEAGGIHVSSIVLKHQDLGCHAPPEE
jgi:hypothetical protein